MIISAGRPDLVIVNKKKKKIKKTLEHENDSDSISKWRAWYGQQGTGIGTRIFGNKKTRGNHRNYSIVVIGKNTEKCQTSGN